MLSTLLSFRDKYYQYHGGDENGERGLSIGGIESAFLADLVAIYLLKETIDLYGDEHPFKVVYCDNDIYVTKEKWDVENLRTWLHSFQQQVEIIGGSRHVQFTGVIWDPDYLH